MLNLSRLCLFFFSHHYLYHGPQARPKGGGGGGGVRLHPPFGSVFLLVREVGNVRWVPLLCVRKIDPKNLRSKKKEVTESPPLISFFRSCVTFEAGGGPGAKPHPPFQKASYGPNGPVT